MFATCGDVAQLGERGLCKPEVVGSIPIVSTRNKRAGWGFLVRLFLMVGALAREARYYLLGKPVRKGMRWHRTTTEA